jgi:adenine-specific DNA-methyltransferase
LKLHALKPRKFINPLLSKRSVTDDELQKFETALNHYLDELRKQITSRQTEPNIVSNALQPFFNAIGYAAKSYSQKGQSGIDLALMSDHEPSVIIEAKAYGSTAMISQNDLNKKAFHEAILYFMREREKGNRRLFHIIITDFYRWFVFDAKDFEKLFWQNSSFRKIFESVKDPSILGDRTSDFYNMTEKFISDMKSNTDLFEEPVIKCAYFDLGVRCSEKERIALYKLFSKDMLFKQFNPNDANSLNRIFYNEFLYILGLEEYQQGGKKLIGRSRTPQYGSLYENISRKLAQYGKNADFETVIQLMIIWINRILFLKVSKVLL